MSSLILKQKDVLSFTLVFLMIMSSSFPNYDYFNFFKICLLLFSGYVILKYKSFSAIFAEKKFLAFAIYSILLVTIFIREIDSFSLRIVFNLIVTIVSSAAILCIGVRYKYLVYFVPMVLLFALYNYFFNINIYDGKPQVHAQIFTLTTLAIFIRAFSRSRALNILLLIVVILSKVRSVLLGVLPVIVSNVLMLRSGARKIFDLFSVVFSLAIFMYLYLNFEQLHALFGESLNSLSWRFYHWENLFENSDTDSLLLGEGLGHSWRITLFIDTFYADGLNYIAAHSNYVKVISETGFLGLSFLLILFGYLYKESNFIIRSLIVFYFGYGFYDEGIWLYSFFWSVVLVGEKGFKDD